jgi:hypothetical protein
MKMAKAADVVKQLRKDVTELRKRVVILEALVENLIGEKPSVQAPEAPESLGSDTWDPSRGPRPEGLRKAGLPSVAHEDHVLLHRSKKSE